MNASARSACWVLLAVLAPFAAALPQSASAPAPGYDVERSQSVQNAPAGSIGRKTADRERRVGTAEDTLGNEAAYVLTFGGFARRCPTSAGIVRGDFEYSIVYDATETGDDGVIRREHHARRLVAQLEGHVGDDARLEYVELNGDFTIDRGGTDMQPSSDRRPVRTRFTPGPLGEPDFPAMSAAVEMTADVAVASVILSAGVLYREAELEWLTIDECVEFSFEPPTDTAMLGPNESREVSFELRAKEDGAPVPWISENIGAIGGIGTVSPRRVQPADKAAVTLKYTASERPRRGHGIDNAATSRAGVANGKWRIVDRYEGTFTQRRETTVGPSDLPAPFAGDAARYGIGVSQDYEIAGRLVWAPDRSRPQTFGEVASTVYVPADGEITVTVHGDGRSMAGACTQEGSKTFAIRELPRAALQYLQLEVAGNGQYKLMLGLISYYLQFQVEGECNPRNARRIRYTVDVNDADIALGMRQGTLTNEAVVGETGQPIIVGRDRYTGRWEFKPPGEQR